MAKINFDSSSVEPNSGGDYTPVPPGEYALMVAETELKQTKSLNGLYLKTKIEIVEGEYKGRYLFVNFNVKNPSQKAQDIGLGQLSALCHACGLVGMVEDSEEMHGLIFRATVGVKEAQGEYPANNYIKTYIMPEAKKAAKKAAKSAGKAKSSKSEVVEEKSTIDDDDIPF